MPRFRCILPGRRRQIGVHQIRRDSDAARGIRADGGWQLAGPDYRTQISWAIAPTLKECGRELRDEVEDWLVFALARHSAILTLDGVTVAVPQL